MGGTTSGKASALARARKEHQHKVSTIEAQIVSLELQQKKLVLQLEDPATYGPSGNAMDLNRELMGVSELLERFTREWDALAGMESQCAAHIAHLPSEPLCAYYLGDLFTRSGQTERGGRWMATFRQLAGAGR